MRHRQRALLVLLALGIGPPAEAKDDARWLADASQAPRIGRVEQGLPTFALSSGETVHLDVQAWMEAFGVPGLSIAVFDNFRTVWKKSYGVRNVGSGLPVTLDTTFQAGSISKPLTAMAVMHFVQQGRFSLDEPVNDRLVSWKVPDNQFTAVEKVTLRRLLSHSAGLTVHGFPGYAVGEPIPTLVQVLDGTKPANTRPVRVEMVPGTKFQYSGGGTTIVQLFLVEQLKKPFPQILDETLFQPLGLKRSSYQQPQPPARAAFSATGHTQDGKPVEGRWHIYPEMAAAGLWTTAGDLAEVAIEVAKSKHGRSNRILSQASTQEMLTVQAEPVGIGFFLDSKSDRFGHNGDDEGFQASLVAFSDSGKGAVIMVNSANGFAIYEPLMASLAKEYGWTAYPEGPVHPFLRFRVVAKKLGVQEALQDYAAQRAQGPAKLFDNGDLNASGYSLLGDGQVEDAIRVFQANVGYYPDDANAYDSLGEGYMKAGKKDLAVENYRKSLKMNPANHNAVVMLGKLGVTWTEDAGAK
jgi:CubicO group peptidase (beta-lactamase class C family)